MAEYSVTFARSARKELEQLPKSVVARIFPRIEALAANPRPPGCTKLVGSAGLWRIRIGEYRVVYSITDEEQAVDVTAVRHRRDAYK